MAQIKESSLENALKWFLGIITIVGFLITIYLGFIRKTSPQLEYDILSVTNFFNNAESASYITILVDSTDIQKNHLNISAYNIKIGNKGNAHISNNDYDDGFWGLKINNGVLLEPPVLLESSTEYLSHKFIVCDSLKGSFLIPLPTLSLDIDDYYIIKVIILHNSDTLPSFQPEGKISGQKNILVNNFAQTKINVFSEAFDGNILVQIIRFFAYLILTLLLLIIFVILAIKIDETKEKNQRKKIIKEISHKTNILPFVKEDFINNGRHTIESLYELYQMSEPEVSIKYQKSKRFIEKKDPKTLNNKEQYYIHFNRLERINHYVERGYLILNEDDTIQFNIDAKKSIKELHEIMARNGLLSSQKVIQIKNNIS